MKEHHQSALGAVIAFIFLTSLACQAVSFGREQPDLEATRQTEAGMEETRIAEEGNAETEVLAPAKSG